ncbi:MAG: phosphatidylglycerophosphatase A [Gammaproteobacteria bacterium]
MSHHPDWKTVVTNPIHLIAFGFGSGLAPKAPGTFGTLAAIPIYLLLAPLSLSEFIVILSVLCLFSIYIAGKSAQMLGVHDHGGIVIDEICGYLVTMALAPPGWQWVIIGFVLFRIFDIFKPWPINLLDKRISGGLGIVLDDLMAGIYALLSLELIIWLVN